MRNKGGDESHPGGVLVTDMVSVVFDSEGEVIEENGGNVETAPFGGEEGAFGGRRGGEATFIF